MGQEIIVDEELVQNYSRIKGVSLDEARERLKENMIKEANVDIRQQMTTLMNAFRKMSPQLTGVINREGDYANGIAEAKKAMTGLDVKFNKLLDRLDFERETYAKAMVLLNGIIKEDAKTMARIAALEATSEPLYKRVWNRIKCLLTS